MRTSRPAVCRYLALFFFCFAFLAASSFAQVNGALFTTTSTGATVDGNIYMSKSAVYLNGGPQNQKDPGLVPDGTYYFQVTDPSGSVLLSLDDISCRQVVVLNGKIVGVPTTPPSPACVAGIYHALGTFNIANGEQPIQLCNPTNCANDFANTPNSGGEYKAWITPVANYNACSQGSQSSHIDFGFCDSDSKTDNFKIQKPGTASVTVCKFQDLNDDGNDDAGDPLIPGWPISATGADSGGPTATGQDGCASYTVSNFPNTDGTQTVQFTEGTLGTGWTQTAPGNTQAGQNCTLSGTFNANDTCVVTGAGSFTPPTPGGVITVTVSPNDNVVVPFFGNTFQSTPTLQVSKTAVPSYEYTWGLKKSVNLTEIDDSTGTATFNYTVTVTNNGPSGWMVQGVISVFNPGSMDINGVTVTDSITDSSNHATSCPVADAVNMTVPAGSTVNFNYTCMFKTTNPGSGTNTATAAWPGGSQTGTANYDFAQAMVADTSVTVTDSLAGNLGTVSIDPTTNNLTTTPNATNQIGVTSSAPGVFNYSYTFNGDASGTCTSHNNTATFTTSSTNTTGNSNTVTVKQCVGADAQVAKTATASFNSSIGKSVDKTTVQQSGGNITFNYTVTVTESAWTVSGYITVTNPNDWESLTVNVSDLIDSGGTCVVTGGTGVVLAPQGSSGPLAYSCSYTTKPTLASGINSAYAAITSGITPHTSVSGTAMYAFSTLTITDTQNGCTTNLGTISVTTTTPNATPGCSLASLKSPSFGVFTYSWTIANSNPGTCSPYNDTAQIVGGGSSTVTVTVCNTNTGALTMGFWKNTNGQKIINAGASTNGACNLGTWLRLLNPFQDLSATASCKQVATYVSSTIGAAMCGGSTCNAMLKAQMLATSLDVYFSTPGLGGNQIGAYNGLGSKTPALGAVAIDLSHICSMLDTSSSSSCTGVFEDVRPEFGIVSSCGPGTTVSYMLSYADFLSATNGSPVSNAGGTNWYKQIKNPNQVYAKDGFDNINNQVANIDSGTVCSPSF